MTRLSKIISIIAFVAPLLSSCGGAKSDGSEATLAVSIEPQRYLLEQIVGDKYKVVTMLSQGANPENYDPTMRSIMDLERSAAYFHLGNPGFEETLVRKVSDSGSNVVLVDCSKGVQHSSHECADHDHSGVHGSGDDPHIWSSVKNTRVIAKNMYEAMLEIDATNSEYYRERYQSLDQHLDSLDQAITLRLQPFADKAFMVWHPSLSYFANDYDLHQLSVGADNKEISAKALRQRIDEAREHNASVFLLQPEYDDGRADNLIKATNARSVTINLLGYDWEGEMMKIVDAITQPQ